MEVGDPERVIEIFPLENPVPERAPAEPTPTPVETPAEAPATP